MYSDCLFPEFIESVNSVLNAGKFSYDKEGIKAFAEELRAKNPKHEEFVNQLEAWIVRSI